MRSLIIGAVVLLLVGFGIYAASRKGAEEVMMKDETAMMEKDATATEEPKDEMMTGEEAMAAGSYEAYAPEKLARAADGDVVLFFRASWCPTCRAADADIRSNLGSIPSDMIILDVDYDTETALKQKYGVTYQHTFVQVDASGNQLAKWTGSLTLADVLANTK